MEKSKHPIFDIVIAGGGPGGTATAFRARELGLRVLILEYDDLMKRIRDYSKAKLILPNFGGGDTMKFPSGGEMVGALRFAPIDKDEMVLRWKGYHGDFKVPCRLGVELTGFKRREDGLLHVQGWHHGKRNEVAYLGRNLVLALGNGVPRRFDIPGNTEGIAFRLDQGETYVGQPACVIGGGTSAAEAVIAISNAKAAAGDKSAVFWSYRGDRLPRVSKALAEVFFEAYAGNGNIRYYPNSEPTAVVTGPDHQDYLSIRVDRKELSGRPVETTHLEFPKTHVLACIGEDLPEALLADMGIPLVHGGKRGKKRVVVNRSLETCQAGVYMVGDLLSQSYLCTEDFDANPAGFEEVKHRGNIKAALRDGVLVAQVIKQRLEGKHEIQLQVGELEDLADSSVKPGALPEAIPMVASSKYSLQRLLPNGVVEAEYPLDEVGALSIGRVGDVALPDDAQMATNHARLSHGPGGFQLENIGEGEIFLVVPAAEKRALEAGDLLRVGNQFLLIEAGPGGMLVKHYDHRGQEKGAHAITVKTMILGREAPDVTLSSEDRSLSRRHLALSLDKGRVYVKDLKSANLTYLRMRDRAVLQPGDRFQAGSWLFAVTQGEHHHQAAPSVSHTVQLPTVQAKPATSPGDGPSITIAATGQRFAVLPGQTICDAAEAHGVAIRAECHMGICGSDPIKILAGAENMVAPPDEGESETLEDICGLEPGPCRLACKARIKGPVTIEIV